MIHTYTITRADYRGNMHSAYELAYVNASAFYGLTADVAIAALDIKVDVNERVGPNLIEWLTDVTITVYYDDTVIPNEDEDDDDNSNEESWFNLSRSLVDTEPPF